MRRWGLLGFVIGCLIWTAVVQAQGPFSAQIQAALRAFIIQTHTWTASQSFSGGATCSGTCSGFSSGGAPVDAQYWTGAADGTLTMEKNLGALGTALVINTGGVPSAFTTQTCTNQVITALSAVGSATCTTVALGTYTSGNYAASVAGTTNRVSISGAVGAGQAAVVNIDAAYVGQTSLTTLGTVTTGTWNAAVLGAAYGGTGVANNASSTLTISGNFATTLTVTNTTSVTLPTTGTLVNTAVTTLSSLASIGTITSGTWTGTTIAFANGGTGLTTAADDTVMVSSGSAWIAKAVADCTDTGGNHLNYTASTNAFSCGTTAGTPTFTNNLTFTTGNALIQQNTSDGSDSRSITISSGGGAGDSSRAGAIVSYGNENGTLPGGIGIYTGNVAGSAFKVISSDGGSAWVNILGSTGATTLGGAVSITGHTTFEGVTSTGATGTGKLVYDTAPTLGAITVTSCSGCSNSITPRNISATNFEGTGRFTKTTVGTGAGTFDTSGVTLDTSAIISSSVVERWDVVRSATGGVFVVYPGEFGCGLDIDGVGTDIQAFVGLGSITIGATGITYTSNHIGFKMVRAASGTYQLFATQAGGTETASSALTSIVNDDFLDLSFRIDSASSVSYYWRKNGSAWSAATTLTTNIPTLASDATASFGVSNAGVATQGKFHVHNAFYSR